MMTGDRRKYDEKIDTLLEVVAKMSVKVDQVHHALFGKNGNPGMKSEWDQMKGGLGVWRWIAGSGGLIAIGLLIIEIVRFLR